MIPAAPSCRTPLLSLVLGLLLGTAGTTAMAEAVPATTLTAPATTLTAPAPPPQTPDLAYPELFQAVQQHELFDDQKHFVDALPLRDPALINADYLAQRQQPGFDLRRFVAANFEESDPVQTGAIRQDTGLREHIDALWPRLVRRQVEVPPYSSLLPLPHPYVVPGGRFREVYYWDSYFTMLGLVESGEQEHSRQMLDNFAYMIDTYGHIPNGNRTYYLSRSQPPFFSYMVQLQAKVEGDAAYARYLPQLQKEYAYWMEGAETLAPGSAHAHVVRLADGSLLNRYWDARDTPRPEAWLHDVRTAAEAKDRPAAEVYRDLRAGAESGWDYSSRWLGDRKTLASIRTTAIVPVDLNSLLYHLETTLALACAKNPDVAGCNTDYAALASARKTAIDKHLWSDAGYYADYDWQQRRLRGQVTAAALFPLFVGAASPARAKRSADTVQAQLLRPGGLATTSLHTGQQWDEPNGWAPLQWIAVDGLRRYGQDALAQCIGTRFLTRVQALFAQQHKLVEKYAVDGQAKGGGGGEYALQDGFGWTNGVTLLLMDLYAAPAAARAASHAQAQTEAVAP
ncbi:alpha,alpha-trehalase TreA [Paracidovorax citrulli]|uniref:Periplasmic trehalase n=2 Tax=Paracidovorax citrulli TaxID=80869 RepID=A1TIN8_PARC0|nr:alpha,alpha-trehalase TreA [Paracidovorax citrulli]ABM30826.1 Alpha,alpha-trehalase [Paracidovorax citrulli AAC00-1]ATG95997.1 alpha,alpha-trehalase [Paracidovorax citrulli]MVT29763.1 alpha,alpha-trehalase TreA [Paracidovorax citrulli]PVY64999.1 alpha,alpha-trehalase [Paracidovorax citrulli]REG70809.1 alpha,alpha-trehalase [Paracidovorax citrulli]